MTSGECKAGKPASAREDLGHGIKNSGLFFGGHATQEQASQAVFNYLVLGEPHWEDIRASVEPVLELV
jgi:hypothetical protein